MLFTRLLCAFAFLFLPLTLAAGTQTQVDDPLFFADGGHGNDENHGETKDDDHHDNSDDHHSDDGHHDEDDHHSGEGLLNDYVADVSISLRSEIVDAETMAFVGMSEGIEDVRNPSLTVKEGQIVEITLANTTLDEHDIVFVLNGKEIHSDHVVFEEDVTTFAFLAEEAGEYSYYCSVEGHREAGMEGSFIVTSN